MKPILSHAAAGLLRALRARAGLDDDKLVLSHWHSVDWQSLTFTGERHEIGLLVSAPFADEAASRLVDGIADAEFTIPGQIVADIALERPPQRLADGSMAVAIEALTIAD